MAILQSHTIGGRVLYLVDSTPTFSAKPGDEAVNTINGRKYICAGTTNWNNLFDKIWVASNYAELQAILSAGSGNIAICILDNISFASLTFNDALTNVFIYGNGQLIMSQPSITITANAALTVHTDCHLYTANPFTPTITFSSPATFRWYMQTIGYYSSCNFIGDGGGNDYNVYRRRRKK